MALPNLAFVTAGQFIYLTRPAVNIDYLLLGSVAGLLSKRTAMVVYAVLLTNDAFVSLSPVFHFGLDTALTSVTLALVMRLVFSWRAVLLLGGVASVAIIGERITRDGERRVRPSLLIVALLVLGVDTLGGTSAWYRTDAALLRVNVATSALYKTTAVIGRELVGARANVMAPRVLSGPPATDALRSSLIAGSHTDSLGARHVLLVIVESLGHSVDRNGDSTVLAPLLSLSIRARYDIRSGTVRTHGATTSGELRELCNIDADYRVVDEVDANACLPSLFRAHRFRTIAVHGYTQGFFARYQWYPRIGFDQVVFAEQLTQQSGIALCGTTFRGVCDADASRAVAQQLTSAPLDEQRFVYWLTLTSHLPVDRRAASASTLDCQQIEGAQQSKDVCALMRMHRLVAEEVASIALDPALPRTRFVLVGDHPPPFFSRTTRSVFGAEDVPFVELIPKPAFRH